MKESSTDGSETVGGNTWTLGDRLLVGIGAVLLTAVCVVVWWFSSGAERSRRLLATAKVRVVDPAGSPMAGILVNVKWRSWRGTGFYYHWDRVGPSDASGRVDLAPLARELAVDGNYELVAGVIGARAEPVSLTERTELVVPPTGKVVAQLVDSAGRPLHHADFTKQLAVLFSPGDQASRPWSADGRVEFAPVACGVELSLGVRIQGWSNSEWPERSSRERTRDGELRGLSHGCPVQAPARAGDVVEVLVTIPDDLPRLVAVVRNADGTPADEPMGLALQIGGGSFSAFTVHPDATGTVSFLLGRKRTGQGELFLRRSDGAELRHSFRAGGEGGIQLGELRFDR